MADTKWEGRMGQIKGRVRSTWGDVTDDDYESARGDMETLIGKIKEKTGESVEAIREKFDQWFREDEEVETRRNMPR